MTAPDQLTVETSPPGPPEEPEAVPATEVGASTDAVLPVKRFTWRFQLYRLFNVANELIYIGITGNINSRFERHSEKTPWWNEVASCTVEFFFDRRSLSTAESSAIYLEKPLYNVQHRTGMVHLTQIERDSRSAAIPRDFSYPRIGRVSVDLDEAGLDELMTANAETRAQRFGDLIAKHQAVITELSRLRAEAVEELMSEGWIVADVAHLLHVSTTRIGQIRGRTT